MTASSFAELGLSPEILEAIQTKGFTKPSPIQAGVIPLLLHGKKDIIGQAQTGTGKTAAFALPLLERLDVTKHETQAIVLAPTRELAVQVAKEIQSFGVKNSPTVTVVYGGNPMYTEISALKKSPTIVVGTPGRMQHHIRNGNLKLDTIRYFVLDEADEMLNFGFREEIEEILAMTPPKRRVLLFSATMPRSIMNIVHKYMGDYDTVKISPQEMTNENIDQLYYCVRNPDKFEALCRIMEGEETFYAIVFCRTKMNADVVANQLAVKHLRAEAIHGDIDQSQRTKILSRFKEGKTNILVATDVAARGIDITDLNFVVNYSLPESYEIYTHRIGRTGRAGNKGTAITLIARDELSKLRFFERNLKVKIRKGELPSPKTIVAKKQQHLIERIEHIILNENTDHLQPLADLLLEEGNPKQVISALLRDSFRSDFNVHTYRSIPDDEQQAPPPKKFGNPSNKPWKGGGGGKKFGNRSAGKSGGRGYRGKGH